MRLGVLSDTHDRLDRTRAAVALLLDAGADALVHCGDLTTPAVVELCSSRLFDFVLGNHDADSVPALTAAAARCGATCHGWGGVIDYEGVRVGITHGHLRTDVRRVLAARPHYLLTGHSHEAHDCVEGGVRRVNPGALHRADRYTVAVIDVAAGEVRFLDVPR